MDVSTVVEPIVAGLLGGGLVRFYLARSQRGKTIVQTAKGAVDVLEVAMRSLEAEVSKLVSKVATLEDELVEQRKATALALQVSSEAAAEALRVSAAAAAEAIRVATAVNDASERHIALLHAEIERLNAAQAK
jgi:hypothetical protein